MNLTISSKCNREECDKPSIYIAFILEKFPSSTEHFVLNEICELKRKGIQVEVLVLKRERRYLDFAELEELRSNITYLPRIFYLFPFLIVFIAPALINYQLFNKRIFSRNSFLKNFRNCCYSLYFKYKLKGKNITHVHAHFAFIATDVAQMMSHLLNINYSFTAHAQDIYANVKKIKQVAAEASFIITCTRFNKNYINKITESKYDQKIYANYHGIEISQWVCPTNKVNFKDSTIRILAIARLVEKKGLEYLLQAIKLLIDQGMKVNCTIIGEGPLRNRLQDYVRRFNISDFVRFIGFIHQPELIKHFNDSDIFVLPCIVAQNRDMDGLPNVILEAMACGVPVISTPISAITEAIDDKKTGLVVAEKNGKAIADAILELRNNRSLYESIALNGRKKILDKFTITANTTSLIEIYKKMSNTWLT